jgi:membrane protein DedA with SNARE-associated domain
MDYYLEHYGYIAVLIGTIIEGGTLLTMAGFMAHQGYLQLVPWVILAGFVGNFIDSQIFYFLGYRYGAALVEKHPRWKPRLEKIDHWILRYHALVIIWYRFLAGFRTAGGIAIGMSGISPVAFTLLNLVGSLLWATSLGFAGYFLGRSLEMLTGDIKRFELPILLAIALVGGAVWCFIHLRHRTNRARF